VAVGVEDGPGRVGYGQVPTTRLAVSVVFGATVDGEMGRLVDKRSSLGIGTGVRGPPESTAEVDLSESVGIDVSIGVGSSAGATVVGEARELAAADQPEVVLDDALARRGVGTEPGSVSERATRDTPNVRVGSDGIGLGAGSSSVDLDSPGRRATDEGSPLVVDG